MVWSGARLVVSGLIRCGGSILVVENSSPSGSQWSAPGGKVEAGEAPIAAVIREIHEECGIEIGPPRRLAHATYMTFAAPEGGETWLALGYEFLLDQKLDLPDWTDPDAGVLGAEWLELEVAAERVGRSAIPPVARALVDYCSAPDDGVTRYYEFDVDLSQHPGAQVMSSLTIDPCRGP